MRQRRSGCGCLLGLVFLGALVGGPTILGKTEDTVHTVPAPTGSGPTSSAPTGSPPPTTGAGKTLAKTTLPKTAAPKAPRAPLPPERAPKTTAPAKPPRTAVPEVEAPDAPPPAAYYANCAAARAAGAAPLLIGQPGYRAALDRDHDGVACET